MASKVYTTSTCDRCGTRETREGADGSMPPVGWATCTITKREVAIGWTNHTSIFNGIVCPGCTMVLSAEVHKPK